MPSEKPLDRHAQRPAERRGDRQGERQGERPREQPSRIAAPPRERRACVFSLARSRFAIDVSVVTSIVRAPSWRYLPLTAPAVLGAIAHPRRPQALPVIDLASVLELPAETWHAVASAPSSGSRQAAHEHTVLLLEMPGLTCPLVCCAVLVVSVLAVSPLGTIQPAAGAEPPWVAGYLPQASGAPAVLIDTVTLAMRLEALRSARDERLTLTA